MDSCKNIDCEALSSGHHVLWLERRYALCEGHRIAWLTSMALSLLVGFALASMLFVGVECQPIGREADEPAWVSR